MQTKIKKIVGKWMAVTLTGFMLFAQAAPAHAIIIFTDELFTNESPAYQIGTTKDAAIDPIALYFGDSNSQAITWDTTKFTVSGTTAITGGVSATGQANFSTSAGFRIREVANPATASCATVGELVLNTTSNQIFACTVIGSPGTWTSTASAGQDLESVYNTDADKILNTSNGALTVNTGTNDFVVTSNDWSVNAAGMLTASGGASISGGPVNVNTNANQATNINTGTSTGLISIGGGSGTAAINTTSWDVSSAGVASGLTGLTSTGQVNFSGASGTRIREIANPLVASCATVGELVFNTTDSKIYACTVVGAPGTWSNTGSTITPDFEGVYTQDADKILTTSNGAFTVAAGTGAVNVNSTTGGISLNSNVNGAVNIATGTSTGAVTVGGGSNTVAVNSSDWDIGTTGDMTGVGAVAMDGNFSQTGATTFGTGTGAISLNGATTVANGNTFTANGVVALGDNGDTVAINSSDWDINATGDMTGIGAVTMDGNFSQTGATTFGTGTGAVSLNGATTVANGSTFTANGVVALGDGGDTVAVNSSDWDISATGDMTGIGAVTMDGVLTGTAGATLSGAVIGLNGNSNFATNINTGTSTGTVSIGGNGNNVAIDSSVWDISSAGVASGLTGITSTGTVNLSGTSAFRTREVAGIVNPGTACTTVGELIMDTNTQVLYACTNAGTDAWQKVGTGADAGTLSGLTSGQFLRSDANSALTTGNTLTINNGATLSVAGTFTATNGGSISGAPINLNNNSNFATNIGTGTSTGTVSIGNSLASIGMASSTWNITTAGVASGFTGFTSTGPINLSGASSFLIPQGAADPGTCAVGQQFYNTTSNQLKLCTAVNTWSVAGPQNFEAVYGYDADKILTTANGAFTIAAGTGAVNVNSTTGGINLNNNVNGDVNIATGTSTGTVTLGGTGAQTIAVGSGAGAKTVNMGSNITTSTTNLLSGSGGLNLNVNNNQVSNINTGTSTGQVNVGGNANCVNVNSNTWDISCSGLATGFTGLTSTGNINFTGATSFRAPQAASDPGTCNVGQEYFNTTTNSLRLCVATNTWSGVGAAGTQYVFAYDTTTQTVAVANTFQDVTYSNNSQIDGWTHTPGTATFTATAAGTYMVNMTARIAKSGGANTTLSFVGVKNTTGAPGTFTEITGTQSYGTAAASSGDTMSGNFIVNMAATEILKIQMTGGTTGAQIVPGGNGTTLPSSQLSIWRLK